MRKRNFYWDDFVKFLEYNSLSFVDSDDFAEGSLLDNYLFVLDEYTVFCYEKFETCWSSSMEVLIVPNKHKNVLKKQYERWNSLTRNEKGDDE